MFPKGTKVQPGSTLTLRVGKGTNTATTLYWGYTAAHFKNVDEAGGFGDGGYLYDPDGDVRAHAIYPCLYACSDSLQGRVNITVNYDAPGDDVYNPNGEYVVVSPRGTTPINLAYKVLSVGSSTYEIPRGTVVNPGEELVVRMGKGTNSRLNSSGGGRTGSWSIPAAPWSSARPRTSALPARRGAPAVADGPYGVACRIRRPRYRGCDRPSAPQCAEA